MGWADLVPAGHRSTWEVEETSSQSQLWPWSPLIPCPWHLPSETFPALSFVCPTRSQESVRRWVDMAVNKTEEVPDLMTLIFWWEETKTNKISVLSGERCPKEQWSRMRQAGLYLPGYVWEWNLPDDLGFSGVWGFSQWSRSESDQWPLGRNIVFRLWFFLVEAIVLKRTDEGRLPGTVPQVNFS